MKRKATKALSELDKNTIREVSSPLRSCQPKATTRDKNIGGVPFWKKSHRSMKQKATKALSELDTETRREVSSLQRSCQPKATTPDKNIGGIKANVTEPVSVVHTEDKGGVSSRHHNRSTGQHISPFCDDIHRIFKFNQYSERDSHFGEIKTVENCSNDKIFLHVGDHVHYSVGCDGKNNYTV